MNHSLLRSFSSALGALCLLATSLGATWSIVAVNTRTGEVCVASATCIARADLTLVVPVIVVGKGGGVTQSVLDRGENRLRIRDGFLAGDTPEVILALIESLDGGFRQRQIGIVDFSHDPVTFTGSGAGGAKKGVVGRVGDVVYAIQGNVLTGRTVVDECRDALRTSTGDLGQRVLAAMVRAREFGGDGRCSCTLGAPDSCGAPPADFEKSAHCGFLQLARMGDQDGTCTYAEGCSNGSYYLDLNIKGRNAFENDPDPVDQLVQRYATWRANRAGRPDGILSTVEAVDSLPADGVTEREVRVRLVDIDGHPLDHGGADVQVTTLDGLPPLSEIGPVVDRGDGTYSFSLRAGKQVGTGRLVITAEDALVRATLYPYLELRSDPPKVLHAGLDRVSAGAQVEVPFVVQDGERPRAKYWLVARLSSSGKTRGSGFDPYLLRFVVPARTPFFPGPPGVLDSRGRSEVAYRVPAGVLLPLIGMRLDWTARIFGRGAPVESNTVGFEIGG